MIEIKLTASDELLSALRGILSLAQPFIGQSQSPSEIAQKAKKLDAPAEKTAPEAASVPTLEEVRAIASQAAKKDKERCFEIIKSYHAANLTALPPDKRTEFLARIQNEILNK